MKRKSENALTNNIVQGKKKTRKEYESKSNPSKQES